MIGVQVGEEDPLHIRPPHLELRQALQSAASRPLGTRTFQLLSAVPFSPASHLGQKMEARGLVYTDPADSKITLTSLKPTGEACP